MKSFRWGCKSFKDGVIVASVFLGTAIVMLFSARVLVPQIAHIDDIVNGFRLVLLAFVPVILVGSWLRHGAPRRHRHIDDMLEHH